MNDLFENSCTSQKELVSVSFPVISGINGRGGAHFADGSHHSSMIAFEGRREATYRLYLYRGTAFEIIETIEIFEDGQRLI